MTYRGYIRNGTVVLEDPAALPEGTKVEIRPVDQTAVGTEEQTPTLYERYKDFIGIADGLPPDASENHDHYLYGTPKR